MSYYRGSYNYSEKQNNIGQSGCTPSVQKAPSKAGANTNMQSNGGMGNAITSASPILPMQGETPTTVQNPYYTAGFLKKFLGRNMRVEFLIGTNGALVDRVGVLVEVGASYIVLQPYLTDDLLMCDLYAIKFVNIYG